MPIEEKPQLLEFDCKLDSMPDVLWNIKYDPNNVEFPLYVSGNGQSFKCPVELFGDVTAFLQSKNIIKPNILTRGRTVSTPGFGPVAASLLPPKIEGALDPVAIPISEGHTEHAIPISSGPPMDALSSFDITSEASVIAKPVVNDEVIESIGITEIPEISAVKVGETVVTSETESDIPKRTVIRTRISGDDPQSAEKEADAIRGAGKEVKKNFKRA
jgi:hypothetical protein